MARGSLTLGGIETTGGADAVGQYRFATLGTVLMAGSLGRSDVAAALPFGGTGGSSFGYCHGTVILLWRRTTKGGRPSHQNKA